MIARRGWAMTLFDWLFGSLLLFAAGGGLALMLVSAWDDFGRIGWAKFRKSGALRISRLPEGGGPIGIIVRGQYGSELEHEFGWDDDKCVWVSPTRDLEYAADSRPRKWRRL